MANIPKVWNGTAFIELEAAATVGPAASTTVVGMVQLSDSTSTTSSVLAATPTAVKSAYDLAGTAIPKNTVTAAGDILYASGSATVARLGIGTASQVLGIAAGVPAWTTLAAGGGMTALGTVIASSAESISFTSIPTGYKDLMVRWYKVTSNNFSGNLGVRLNNDSGSNYSFKMLYVQGTTWGHSQTDTASRIGGGGDAEAVVTKAGTSTINYLQQPAGQIVIENYTNTASAFYVRSFVSGSIGGSAMRNWIDAYYKTTGTAISQIEFGRYDGGTGTWNGTFILYGVS